MRFLWALCCLLALYIKQSQGHGMMLDPPGRSSRWRYDSSAPTNYDDNALYCGGFATQWYTYNGKCGLCGDSYGLATPRPNELGGRYGGSGVITKTYANSGAIRVGVQITANHLGYIYFNLCNLDEFGRESEACFEKYRLRLADGSDRQHIGTTLGWVYSDVVFPKGLTCRHCVLRWTYHAGNNWGVCEDGTGAMGCGAQENFKSCSDIAIIAPRSILKTLIEEPIEVPVAVDEQSN